MPTKHTFKMPPQVQAALITQREKFKTKFGREPGPNDPVFFDPESDVPTPISEEQFLNKALAATRSAGIPDNKVRQFLKLIPGLTNANKFPHSDNSSD